MKKMEKTTNRVGIPISVVGRGVRSFIRWHSPEEETRMLEQARKAVIIGMDVFGLGDLHIWKEGQTHLGTFSIE